MRKISFQEICEATQVQILSKFETHYVSIGTDTRKDLTGQLFIALKGEAYDAHNYLDKAVAAGASALLVHELPVAFEALKDKVTILKVEDTLKALQNLGTWARRQFKGPVIGITGSNGKTTTKEFTAALIGTCKSVHFNKGSFNNHWGVPFTLLQLDPSKEVAVVEMGMNHYGEITDLVHIAEPDVVVCTMVGRAHIEHFGTIEGIAKAKYEIYEAASEKTIRAFNLDNVHTQKMMSDEALRWGADAAKKFISFSAQNEQAKVFMKIDAMSMRSLKLSGKIDGISGAVEVPVFGEQNLTNLMAAAALAKAVGLTGEQIWKGLAACRTNWGRNQLLELQSGAEMIFDGYNANPDSMKALLDNVRLIKNGGKKIGVFGEMLEMGDLSNQLHLELGSWVGSTGFERVYFIGKPSASFQKGLEQAGYKGYSNVKEVFDDTMAQDLVQNLKSQDVIVVKGSRGMKLERFVLPCQPKDFNLNKE